MGNWNITIEGTGPHHNPDGGCDADANLMLNRFVHQLANAGHKIEHATITAGQRDSAICEVVPQPAPPVDNAHVAPGCEQFSAPIAEIADKGSGKEATNEN